MQSESEDKNKIIIMKLYYYYEFQAFVGSPIMCKKLRTYIGLPLRHPGAVEDNSDGMGSFLHGEAWLAPVSLPRGEHSAICYDLYRGDRA